MIICKIKLSTSKYRTSWLQKLTFFFLIVEETSFSSPVHLLWVLMLLQALDCRRCSCKQLYVSPSLLFKTTKEGEVRYNKFLGPCSCLPHDSLCKRVLKCVFHLAAFLNLVFLLYYFVFLMLFHIRATILFHFQNNNWRILTVNWTSYTTN